MANTRQGCTLTVDTVADRRNRPKSKSTRQFKRILAQLTPRTQDTCQQGARLSNCPGYSFVRPNPRGRLVYGPSRSQPYEDFRREVLGNAFVESIAKRDTMPFRGKPHRLVESNYSAGHSRSHIRKPIRWTPLSRPIFNFETKDELHGANGRYILAREPALRKPKDLQSTSQRKGKQVRLAAFAIAGLTVRHTHKRHHRKYASY